MIIYVDTSTLLKLIIEEEGSDRTELIWQSADSVASVSLVVVEACAALAAAAQGRRLSTAQLQVAKTELATFVNDLHLVERGCDSVHLAAALLVGAAVLTSADRALCEAAERQRLHIADPLTA